MAANPHPAEAGKSPTANCLWASAHAWLITRLDRVQDLGASPSVALRLVATNPCAEETGEMPASNYRAATASCDTSRLLPGTQNLLEAPATVYGQYRPSPAQSGSISGSAFDFLIPTTWDAGPR